MADLTIDLGNFNTIITFRELRDDIHGLLAGVARELQEFPGALFVPSLSTRIGTCCPIIRLPPCYRRLVKRVPGAGGRVPGDDGRFSCVVVSLPGPRHPAPGTL